MLVITRKTDEGLVIGEDTKIRILEVGKDRVRIGIEAPMNVKIIREELYDTEKQNLQAAGALSQSVMAQIMKNKE